MPVSLTEFSTVPSVCLALMPNRPPSGVNLTAFGQKIKHLLDLRSLLTNLPRGLLNGNIEGDAVLCGALAHEGACGVYSRGEIERS